MHSMRTNSDPVPKSELVDLKRKTQKQIILIRCNNRRSTVDSKKFKSDFILFFVYRTHVVCKHCGVRRRVSIALRIIFSKWFKIQFNELIHTHKFVDWRVFAFYAVHFFRIIWKQYETFIANILNKSKKNKTVSCIWIEKYFKWFTWK